jgi:hypothetical protein
LVGAPPFLQGLNYTKLPRLRACTVLVGAPTILLGLDKTKLPPLCACTVLVGAPTTLLGLDKTKLPPLRCGEGAASYDSGARGEVRKRTSSPFPPPIPFPHTIP